jgi:hypothetical protein
MSALKWNAAGPDGAGLCFCLTCIETRPACAAAYAADVAKLRADLERMGDDELPPEKVIARRRERQRQWVLNNPEAERAKRERSHAKEAAKRAALKAQKAAQTGRAA